MYNKTKYNVTLMMLLVVIGFVFGLAPGFLHIDDDIQETGGGTSQTDADTQNEMPTGQFTAPGEGASAFERINFAFKVLTEGEGFAAETKSYVLAMGQKQEVLANSYRAGNEDAIEEWQFANSSLAKNEFLLRYGNSSTVTVKKSSNKNDFSATAKTYVPENLALHKTYTAGEFKTNFKRLNDFSITLNSDTSRVLKYDKKSDQNFYVILLSINISKIDKEYINSFYENGTEGVTFSQMNITLRINKKTGFFYQIEKHEFFKTKYSGLSVDCEAKANLEFKSMNTSAKIKIDEIVNKAFS